MKKRILALLLAFLMFIGAIPANNVYATEEQKDFSVGCFNSESEEIEEVDEVDLYRGGEIYLSVMSEEDISGDIQWQIEAEKNFWVNIQGATANDLRVSYGMVKNLLKNDSVRMRYVISADEEYNSDPVTVTVTDEDNSVSANSFSIERKVAASKPVSATLAGQNLVGDEAGNITIHTVTIEYIYAADSKFHGQLVAQAYIAEYADGVTPKEKVNSPNCVGYEPDRDVIDLISLGAIDEDKHFTVYYSPAEVSYTVRHYQQNVNDDEYTWEDTTLVSGCTEARTDDAAAKTYAGFHALSHYHEEIAADSSTTVDIYYDRDYYLMSFELDGGHGVEAVYARFGADISVSTPQKSGYSFKGWSLDGTTKTSLPTTMPANNSSYTALWEAGGTSYTVSYWLENADTDDKYDFVGAYTVNADSGISVSGSDDAVAQGIFTADERQYYTYNSAKTDTNVSVAGDGSTVVNIYYDRNEYTLKFYYARSYTSGATTYYNVTSSTDGSSAYNGTVADASWSRTYTVEPTLDSKYEKQSEQLGDYTYYYFIQEYKYGQNLMELWPNAPLSNASDTVKFVSWGTQYGSGYHTNNPQNRNIKGIYSIMDKNLLVDPSITADKGVNHWMVGYWGDPTMYAYEIYYSVLSGEISDYTYEGNEYKKVATYMVGSTALPSKGQTPLTFEGVDYVGMNFDKDEMVDGTAIRFFYQRRMNKIVLDDNYGEETTYNIPYGVKLSSYITTVPVPTYPTSLPADAYEFGGWYQSKDGVGALDINSVMPNENLKYYAKWNPKKYEITITDGEGNVLATDKITYGNKATKPADPSKEKSTFVGWYYLDENNKEQRFDFDNMEIKQDMHIYAKWRSDEMKEVEIHYVYQDTEGKNTPIAATETLMLRVGQVRTFEAKTGTSLYADYREGYFPTTASHSITPEEKDLDNENALTYTFKYKKYGAVPYQVEYYVQEKDGTVRPAFVVTADKKAKFVDSKEYASMSVEEKTNLEKINAESAGNSDLIAGGQYVERHWQNNKAIVTELYVPEELAIATWTLPDAYLPDALRVKKIIVPSEKDPEGDISANTIRFIYTYTEPVVDPDNPDPDPNNPNPVYQARYLVQYFIQDPNNTNVYTQYSSWKDELGLSGETVTASPINILGYTYSHEETYNRKQEGTTLVEGTDGMKDVMSGIVTADDSLELNFYYTVNQYPYQVMYLEESTNRVLMDATTTDSDGNPLKANFGSKVTYTLGTDAEKALLDKYVVDAQSKDIYIEMEAGDEANINTIIFKFTRKSADLIISKTVRLDPEQAEELGIAALPESALTQEFEFTVTNPKGFYKPAYDCVITDSKGNERNIRVLAGTTTLSVKIKHGESIRIQELDMGTYTVTETYIPGFRISVNDGEDAQQKEDVSITKELVNANQSETVNFINSYPFYTGELVLGKTVNKADDSDPGATEPYRVEVTLKPFDETREVLREITWTDADGTSRSYSIPKLTGSDSDASEFSFDVLVPVDGTITLKGVPAGTFNATETVKGTIGYIADLYFVKNYVKLHNMEVESEGKGASVEGVIHGGHPTTVKFNNTYKKGDLTIQKTVTQEYDHDNWSSDTFHFEIQGTTELPDGTYHISVDGSPATVTVDDGELTLTDLITVRKSNDSTKTSWTNSITFENLPAGYYTVSETFSEMGLNKYNREEPTGQLLVNNTETGTVAQFTNTYKSHYANLTIATSNATDDGQVFVYEVRNTTTGAVNTVTVTGNGNVTIHDLPFGEYTVTQKDKWSWRYKGNDGKVENVSVGADSKGEDCVIFAQQKTNNNWISDITAKWYNRFGWEAIEQ